MSKVILTKGLPGSGKTTWAKKYCKEHRGTKRVNRDELRLMVDDGEWSKKNERFIKDMRNQFIISALMNGHDIVVDDTNLDPSNEEEIRKLLETINSITSVFPGDKEHILEIQSFLDVPVEECIKRDQTRSGKAHVGEEVIRRFYTKYVESNTA